MYITKFHPTWITYRNQEFFLMENIFYLNLKTKKKYKDKIQKNKEVPKVHSTKKKIRMLLI
jgi:hypothetical protein